MILQDLTQVASHPQGEIIVGVPIIALLVWAGKILYNTTVAQKEMMASLFGTPQAPGIIPRIEHEQKRLSQKLHDIRDDVQAIAVHTETPLKG